MTNNPTIDGELRELFERAWDLLDESQPGRTCNDLRAQLDAPAVERQEPVHEHDCCANCMRPRMEHCGENCPAHNTSVWHAWDYDFAPGTEASPEVTALQSTIAQLQAENSRVNDAWHDMKRELDLAKARVQELESGRIGGVWFPRELGDGLAELIAEKSRVCGAGAFDIWEEVCERFGNAPPAPVVVADKYDEVLLPFLAMMRNELHANAGKGDRPGWLSMTPGECLLEIYYHLGKLQKGVKDGNELWITEYSADAANMAMMLVDICGLIDATAALNTTHVGELDPAQRLALARGEQK